MTFYDTATGSTYLVDEDLERVRRLKAGAAKVAHTLSDGEWHTYAQVQMHGDRLLFTWPPGAPHEFTITSPVVAKREGTSRCPS